MVAGIKPARANASGSADLNDFCCVPRPSLYPNKSDSMNRSTIMQLLNAINAAS